MWRTRSLALGVQNSIKVLRNMEAVDSRMYRSWAPSQMIYPIIPHRVLALQLGRALNYYLGNDIYHCPHELLIHGYNGDKIVPNVPHGTQVQPLNPFDPQLILKDRELTFRLLAYWKNLVRWDKLQQKPIVQPWDISFDIDFWENRFLEHSGELQMEQTEYFENALSFYKDLAPVSPLLLDSCEGYWSDGRRRLNVNDFFTRLRKEGIKPPTLHVHETRGLQDLRELKFYQDDTSGNYIDCPAYRQLANWKNRYKVYPSGIQSYNPNKDLYIV